MLINKKSRRLVFNAIHIHIPIPNSCIQNPSLTVCRIEEKLTERSCPIPIRSNTQGISPYDFFRFQNLRLLFFSSSFLTYDTGGGSGGPEFLKKSARSLVADLLLRISPTGGALAWSLGLYARCASEPTDVDEMAPKGTTPLRVAVCVDESEELDALARALAAAIVSSLSMKGCGLLLLGGSMPLRKSIKLSCRGAACRGACRGAAGGGWLEGGSAVNWSSSSSSSSERSIAYGSLLRRRVFVICGSEFEAMLPDNFCGVFEYAGWTTLGSGIKPVRELMV